MKFLAPVVLLLTGFGVAFAQSGDSLSLEECIRRGLEASESLNSKRFSALAAHSDARAFSAQRKPSLSVRGSYNYTSETQEISGLFPTIPGFTAPSIKFGDGNVYDLNATATIPIYAGGAIISRERASYFDERAQRFDVKGDSLTLLYNIRRAYFLASGASANLDAVETRRARLSRHLDELTSSQKIGVATEDARLAVEASLRSADAAVLQAEAAARNARLQLGKLLGEQAVEYFPSDNLEYSLAEISNGEDVQLATRPEIEMLDARISQRKKLERASKAGLLPSLAANAVYHYAKPGVDMIENEWMDYYTIGVTASWTLWDFNEARSKAKSQNYSAQSLTATRNDALTTLTTRVRTTENSWRAARPAEENFKKRLELETRRSELIKNKLAAGLASESQWLDAQDDLTAAELEWISSVVALRLSEADYLYAIGR